jgi:chemotaxis protein MotA
MNIPLGWLIAISAAIGGFLWLGGTWSQLWVPEEFLVIFGAALGTLIAANKWRHLRNLGSVVARSFTKTSINREANLQLLCLLFELLQKIKKDGMKSIEADIENPAGSPLFSRYPRVLRHKRLVEFITDYFRMMADNTVTLAQLEGVVSQEIETLYAESRQPSQSIMNLADSMPAFGIVAAIVGVIKALSGVATNSPAQIGAMISAALVGTLVGVFAAYAILSPVAKSLEQIADEELKPFEAVKEILLAHFSSFSPSVCVEYGRKVLYSDVRPSMAELEAGVKNSVRQVSP